MVGEKKYRKSKFSWSLPLFRRNREGSQIFNHSYPLAETERGNSEMLTPAQPKSWSPKDVEAAAQSTFKRLASPTESVWSSHEIDHFDGSLKVWKQSHDFFCNTTVYQQQMKKPSRLSVANLEEDRKNWLELLSRKSQLARERFNYKRMGVKDDSFSNGSSAVAQPSKKPHPSVNSHLFAGKSSGNIHQEERSVFLDDCSNPMFEYSSQMHLRVPPLGRSRNTTSTNWHLTGYDGGQTRISKSSSRLVSAWSADTLSLLAGDNEEDDGENLPDCSQTLKGVEDFKTTSLNRDDNSIRRTQDNTPPGKHFSVQLQVASSIPPFKPCQPSEI